MIPSFAMYLKTQKYRMWIRFLAASLFCIVEGMHSNAIDWTQQVDRLFSRWDTTDTPGVALAVVKNGNMVYRRDYGMASLRLGVPITSSTVFNCGSQSKQFTAFAILLLEDEGKLSLDEDIRLYLPEIDDCGRTITIEHLIYHASGLQDYVQLMKYCGWYQFEDVVNRDLAIALLSRQTALNFEPGDRFMYCNSGYMLLAEIVDRVSGMPFREFARQRIFEPLGMSDSCFVDDHQTIVRHLADAYMQTSEGGFQYTPINFACAGDGGLCSTIADIAKWDQNFYDPVVGSEAIFDKMHRNGILNNGSKNPYSMGVIVLRDPRHTIIYHGGTIPGFSANLVRIPAEHLSVITMSNVLTDAFELSSDDLFMKSISILDYYLASQGSAIESFDRYEPSEPGFGTQTSVWIEPDSTGVSMESIQDATPSEEEISESSPLSPAQWSPGPVEEYTGRYYSTALDTFYTVSLDQDGALAFRTSRGQRYLLGAGGVRNDQALLDRGAMYRPKSTTTIKFLRNAMNKVIGFTVSDARTVDLSFSKADIVLHP